MYLYEMALSAVVVNFTLPEPSPFGGWSVLTTNSTVNLSVHGELNEPKN